MAPGLTGSTGADVYQITSYGMGITPRVETLPGGITEEQAIAIAKDRKADPYFGFHSLREVRLIEVD